MSKYKLQTTIKQPIHNKILEAYEHLQRKVFFLNLHCFNQVQNFKLIKNPDDWKFLR